MAETVQRGSRLLQDTETKLRELVSEAATSGDYTSVVQLASWARTLSEMLNRTAGDITAVKVFEKRVNSHKQAPGAKRDRRTYPQFFKQDDQIIRVAWSKREKKEYRHKAAFSTVKLLAKAMTENAADGRVFSTDHFLPIHDAEHGEIPNYQSYLGISFFKHCGLIDQHGRQGYSIPRLSDFKEAVDAVWKKLPALQDK